MAELHIQEADAPPPHCQNGGRLLEIKMVLKSTLTAHGKWEEFYRKTFADSGVTLHRSQRYMRLAKKERPKSTKSFLPGKDTEIDKAVSKQKACLEAATHRDPEYIFWFGLRWNGEEEKKEMVQFSKEQRSLLQTETTNLWRRLHKQLRRAA